MGGDANKGSLAAHQQRALQTTGFNELVIAAGSKTQRIRQAPWFIIRLAETSDT